MPEHSPAPMPSRAVYGFALYLAFTLAFPLYIVWAVVPHEYLVSIGDVTFLPLRYWAVAIPIFLLTVLTVFVFLIYPSLGLCMTPDLRSPITIQDEEDSSNSRQGATEHLHGIRGEGDGNGPSPSPPLGISTVCSCIDSKRCFRAIYEFDIKKQLTRNRAIPVLRDLDMCQVSQTLYVAHLDSHQSYTNLSN